MKYRMVGYLQYRNESGQRILKSISIRSATSFQEAIERGVKRANELLGTHEIIALNCVFSPILPTFSNVTEPISVPGELSNGLSA